MSASIRLDEPTVLASMAALAQLDAGLPPSAAEAAAPVGAHTLPEGTQLLDYEIVGLIGEGGFGIVYLAVDPLLERHVAIKEYLPAALASRARGSQAVVIKSPRHAESFHVGLRSFVNEARLLARFDHPSLVKVLQFWEANGTAYMVMPFYEGHTLAHTLKAMGRAPDEAELRGWLQPLLQALGVLHAVRCIHRDIAPDNILLTPGGPLLLDFGAARRVMLKMVTGPTAMFKPGYAPMEQYGEMPTLKQGPWTDLYALAGVVYAAVTGQPPVPAVERWVDDRLPPLSEVARGRYSAPFLATIDAALALRPADRPASAAEFMARLDAVAVQPPPVDAVKATPFVTEVAGVEAPLEPAFEPKPAVAVPGAATVARPAVAPPFIDPPTLGTIAQPWERRRRLPVYLLLALLLGLGAWGLNGLRNRPASPAVPAAAARAPAPSAAAAVPSAASPAPSALPSVASPASPAVLPSASPVTSPVTSPAATPSAPPVLPVPPAPVAAAVPAGPVAREPAPTRAAPVAAPRQERAPDAPHEVRRPAPETPPVKKAAVPERCSEILQRASLEPLRSAEAAFLKRECRQ